MLKTPSSTVIGGAGIWTPSAWKIGLDVLNLGQLIRNLFSNSEQGFAYDINDLSTLYQDAAGTTPVTATGQPVGLVLDKSKGLALGAEKVVNGDFSNGLTGWTSVVTAPATVTHVNNSCELKAVGTGAIARLRSAVALSDAGWYKVEFDAVGDVSASSVVQIGSTAGGSDYANLNIKTGRNTFYVYIPITTLNVQFYKGANNGTVYIDNVSVKEIKGNHAYQTTPSLRGILRDAPRRIDYDGVDDKLTVNLPAQLTGATVVRAVPNVGTQILTNQTIATPYNDSTDHCGLIVINRALTQTETAQITQIFNRLAGV